MLIINLFITTSLYNNTYILHYTKKTFVTSSIKPSKELIKISIIVSSCWQPTSRAPPCGLGNYTIKTWDNCKPSRPRASGRQLIIKKRHEGTLVDDCTTKNIKILKINMFGTIPIRILSNIYDWTTRLK